MASDKSSSRHAAVSSVFRFLTILRNFCILRLSFLPASPEMSSHIRVFQSDPASHTLLFTRYCSRVAQTATDFADASHSKSAKSAATTISYGIFSSENAYPCAGNCLLTSYHTMRSVSFDILPLSDIIISLYNRLL